MSLDIYVRVNIYSLMLEKKKIHIIIFKNMDSLTFFIYKYIIALNNRALSSLNIFFFPEDHADECFLQLLLQSCLKILLL